MNPVKSALDSLAESLANTLIDADSVARLRLKALDGSTVVIRTERPRTSTTLRIVGDRLLVSEHEEGEPFGEPNAIVTGDTTELLKLLLGGSGRRVTIDGDETLVHELATLMRALAPDAEPLLTPLLGKRAAGAVAEALDAGGVAVRSLIDSARFAFESSMKDASAGRYVGDDDFDDFAARVRELTLATDRLAARISRLEEGAGPS